MQRIEQAHAHDRTDQDKSVGREGAWRMAIAPHDDYCYVGSMYPLVLNGVRARTVVIFGVAHKASQLGLEDQLIFDSFTHWHGPYGDIPVSSLREELMGKLVQGSYQINDEMHGIEHSVEAKLPFLQYFNRNVRFVPILVPCMSYSRMEELAQALAKAIAAAMDKHGLAWGKDVALVSSTDAVHYGDEGWNGRNFPRYGVGAEAYRSAVAHEHQIMGDCFSSDLHPHKIRRFMEYVLDARDHREYEWPWCGRYSVPLGLLTAWHLQQLRSAAPLEGTILGYATSIDHPKLEVDDLGGMGVNAPATLRHWVGYAAIGFR